MNWRAVRAVVRKDLTVVRRSRPIMLPLVIVPVLMLVVLPVGLSVGPALAMRDADGVAGFQRMLASLPPILRAGLEGLTPQQAWVMLVHTSLYPSLYLIVPLMVASVIAADSFAGERERKTLEALLYTPATDGELLSGKLLAGLLPALAVGFGGFVVYAVVANASAWPIMGRVFVPNATWLVLVLWVGPAFAALGVAAMVLVSLRVGTTQEAFQLGGLLVLPIVALVVGQVRGAMILGPGLLGAVGAAAWAVVALLLRYGARSFRRTSLIARL